MELILEGRKFTGGLIQNILNSELLPLGKISSIVYYHCHINLITSDERNGISEIQKIEKIREIRLIYS